MASVEVPELVCPTCRLSQAVGEVPAGAAVCCARCDRLLFRAATGQDRIAALCFALSALLLALPAAFYPILEVTSFGERRGYTIFSGIRALWLGPTSELAIPVALASVILPAFLILTLLLITSADLLGLPAALRRMLTRICSFLQTWSIVDVYLLAILVTVVKLASMTDAVPVLGSVLLFCVVFALALAMRCLDPDTQQAMEDSTGDVTVQSPCTFEPSPATGEGVSGRGTERLPAEEQSDPGSLNRTLALTLAALILFVPANLYPTLSVSLIGSSQSDTILGGVVAFVQTGSWPLGLLVLCASFLVPLGKILGLFFLILSVRMRGRRLARYRLYGIVEKVGRWSMLDIYVISMFVAIMNRGVVASATAEIGAVVFAAVVIVTMIAARSFDPRLIWSNEDDQPSGG